MRRKVAFIYLPIVAAFPMALGSYQIIHFIDWLLDLELNFDFILHLAPYAPFLLVLAFVISLYEKFCIYHRLCIIAVLYATLSYKFVNHFPSILTYNITNILAILLIFVGIIGCVIHFGIQIKDFVRYVRTKR